mgnify:CR=1 FL=1
MLDNTDEAFREFGGDECDNKKLDGDPANEIGAKVGDSGA